jgi:serine/threonine protein kinase
VRYNPQEIQREFPHIAKGSYGIVFKGKVPDVPSTVAIKDMDIVDSGVIDDWKKELTVMNKNQSPYVVEVYGYSNNRNVVTIVMEFMTRGDLFTILHKKNTPLSLLERLRMARHCLLGINLLHQHQVIHRDVKSLNILVSEDFACKLTDFGCAKLMSHDRQILNTANSGTPLWMAPEVKKGLYTFSADIYSIGLVLFELFERKLPSWDDNRKVVILPQSFRHQNIIIPCLDSIPEKRPTAEQMIKLLDQMIVTIVEGLKNSLPKSEQETINGGSHKAGDALDFDLVSLYKLFLSKPAVEVDQLIMKFCGEVVPTTSTPKPIVGLSPPAPTQLNNPVPVPVPSGY